MPKPIVSGLLLAGILATANLPAAEGLLSRLLGDGCFGGYAGAIGDRPITLLIRRGRWYEQPTAWYYLDDTGQYDPVANRLRFPELVLEDDGSQGDEVRLLERADETGSIIGRLTGKLSAEGDIAGEWRPEGAAVVLPFWLQPLRVLPQGRDPAFSIRIREAVLEIAGEEPLAMSGAEGLVEPITDCGPDPFGLSVRRLPGPPDLYVIETEEHGGWGFTDARDLVFVRPGAVQDPLYVATEVARCSTSAGLGWDCDDNRVRYAYQGSVLTIIDEKDAVREVAPELWGPAGCLAVDRSLSVRRWDLKGDTARCDKVVHIRGEPSEGQCEAEAGTATRTTPSPRPRALPAWFFDDGLSGWLLIPREPDTNLGRVTQYPGDPSLDIRPGPGTGLWDGPAPRTEQYNGPNTGWRLACWLYNRAPDPAAFQDRAYPPALAPGSATLSADAPEFCSLGPVEDWWSADSQDWETYSFGPFGTINLRRSADGKALEASLSGETAPLALTDGEHCYHRDLKEPGRWGMPWSEPRYAELFAPADPATAGD